MSVSVVRLLYQEVIPVNGESVIVLYFEIIGQNVFPLITGGTVLVNFGFGNIGIGIRIIYRPYTIEPVGI